MTEQEKEILKESTHILGKYGYSIQENQLKEIIQPKERYHIDVRIECDKVQGFNKIDLMGFLIRNLVFEKKCNATITEIPKSDSVPLTRELFDEIISTAKRIFESGNIEYYKTDSINVLWSKIKHGYIK
jgi:hypothetical protein